MSADSPSYDLVVVGAGIVGLATISLPTVSRWSS